VPLPNGYSLAMIDTPDQAFIESNEGKRHSGIEQLGVEGEVIYARDATSLLRIDTRSRMETVVVRVPVELVSASAYYDAHRWTNADGWAGIVILGVPASAFVLLCLAFLRATFQRDDTGGQGSV
jgi:hypothetical protein